jgi:hypothetical protein
MYLQRYLEGSTFQTQCPPDINCHQTNSEFGDCLKGYVSGVETFICIKSRKGEARMADGISMNQDLKGCVFLEKVIRNTGTEVICSYDKPDTIPAYPDNCAIVINMI